MEDYSENIIDLFSGNLSDPINIALAIVSCLIVLVALFSCVVSIILAVKYTKFNKKENSAHLTGVEVARKVLDDNGLQKIKVKAVGSLMFGNSYSHYFKKVRIRRLTRHKTSITALAIGTEKACLAILDKENDKDMKTRIVLTPLLCFGPFLFVPLLIVGIIIDILINSTIGVYTVIFTAVGIVFFVISLILSIMVLKTEKKAQERACKILAEEKLATNEEIELIKELFKLYNIQYINDIITSALELLYYVLKILAAAKGGSTSSSSSSNN